MTITENDFIEKMIEIAKTGYENIIVVQLSRQKSKLFIMN